MRFRLSPSRYINTHSASGARRNRLSMMDPILPPGDKAIGTSSAGPLEVRLTQAGLGIGRAADVPLTARSRPPVRPRSRSRDASAFARAHDPSRKDFRCPRTQNLQPNSTITAPRNPPLKGRSANIPAGITAKVERLVRTRPGRNAEDTPEGITAKAGQWGPGPESGGYAEGDYGEGGTVGEQAGAATGGMPKGTTAKAKRSAPAAVETVRWTLRMQFLAPLTTTRKARSGKPDSPYSRPPALARNTHRAAAGPPHLSQPRAAVLPPPPTGHEHRPRAAEGPRHPLRQRPVTTSGTM